MYKIYACTEEKAWLVLLGRMHNTMIYREVGSLDLDLESRPQILTCARPKLKDQEGLGSGNFLSSDP